MFTGLFKYFKVVRKELILAIFFILLETVLETLVPYMYAQIVDVGIANRDLPYIYLWGGLMVLSAGLAFFVGIISVKYVARVGLGYGEELRRVQFLKIQSFDAQNRDEMPVSSLITRLTNDTYTIQNTIIMGMRGLFRAPFMIVMVLVLSFQMNASLALVMLVTIPIVALLMFFVVLKIRPVFVLMQAKFDALNRRLQENFTAIRVVKTYVTEEEEISRFDTTNLEYRRIATNGFLNISLMNPIMQFGLYSAIVGLLFVGGHLIELGEAKVGEISGLLTFVLQLMNALLMLAQLMIMFSRSMASSERIITVLNTQNTLLFPAQSKAPIQDGEIVVKDLSFHYPGTSKEQYALRDISFTLKKGGTIGIIGQTGSGKSTLVHLLVRLYDKSGGTIEIDQNPLESFTAEDIVKNINVVFQNNTLFSGSIMDNLRWGNKDASAEEINRALAASLSDEIVGKLHDGLNSEVGQAGSNLSGGQKQRIALARALLRRPKVLILDDALSAIDTINEAKIRKNLRKFYPELSLIIVAQRLSAIKNADHILVLHEGKIHGEGEHARLLKTDHIYRDIYETQLQGAKV